MSKATVKKMLMSMPKEEIIGMVLEMYDSRKEAKEYLGFMQIQMKMESWKSIRRLSQKNSIQQKAQESQRPDSRSVGRRFRITRS